MDQALTQLEDKILFLDSTYNNDGNATEADTMMDVVYEVDLDDDYFWIFTFNSNIFKYPSSNVKKSSLFVSLYVLALNILSNM